MKYLKTYKVFESNGTVNYLKDIFLDLEDSNFEVRISRQVIPVQYDYDTSLYIVDIQRRDVTFKLVDVYDEISSAINYMLTNTLGFSDPKLHSFVARCSDYESDIKSLKDDGEVFKQDFTDLFEGLIQNEYTDDDILKEYDDLYFIRIIITFTTKDTL